MTSMSMTGNSTTGSSMTGSGTTGPVAPLASPPAEQLAEVLLTELVRTLTAEAQPGVVLGGRPHLRLFGEAIDVALPLRALRRLSELAPAPTLELDDDTLHRHACAIADEEGYWLSPAGLYAARGLGTGRDAGVPGDAMSLRLHTSPLSLPMNALLRADPAVPESWMYVVDGLRRATSRLAEQPEAPERPASGSFSRRLARLRTSVEGLHRLDDPRLPRLLGEQLVHAFMAVHALLRQRRVHGRDAHSRRLRRTCALPQAMLAELRRAALDPGHVWRDLGLLSASIHPGHRRTDDPEAPDVLEIRPRVHGSAGRWVDGTIDEVEGPEPMVTFPPGTPFEVLEVLEIPARDGERNRVVARLAELPPQRAASAWTTR